MMGHFNSFSASVGGNLNKNFPKIQMPGGVARGGMLKFQFDWYITCLLTSDWQDKSSAVKKKSPG